MASTLQFYSRGGWQLIRSQVLFFCSGCGHGIGSNWDQRRCQPLSEDTRTCADKPWCSGHLAVFLQQRLTAAHHDLSPVLYSPFRYVGAAPWHIISHETPAIAVALYSPVRYVRASPWHIISLETPATSVSRCLEYCTAKCYQYHDHTLLCVSTQFFVSSHMYPESRKGTQVILDST